MLDLPPGQYEVQWVDTKTGAVAGKESFQHAGGEKRLQSPVFANDVALSVVAAAGGGRP